MLDIESKTAKYVLASSDDVAWSPDGKKVAVLRSPGSVPWVKLLLIDKGTAEQKLIAEYPEADSGTGLSWSPDGKHLAYSVTQKGVGYLYILDLQTGEIAALGKNNPGQYPAWSPKGNIIALERALDLYLIRSDGSCETRIPGLHEAWSPTWSPDGARLAYLSLEGIYILNINEVLGRDIYQNLCS